jgi:hypothetical protein
MKMMRSILVLFALACPAPAYCRSTSNDLIAGPNTGILLKMTSSMSATSSKPGDAVTGEVIDPVALRGAHMDGTISRADHSMLDFTFNRLRFGGKTYVVRSKLMSVTSSNGNEGQDDLGQRIRVEGAAGTGLIAYGTTTALDEGTELRLTIWQE